jgi:Na+/H+ antiporter NhaC
MCFCLHGGTTIGTILPMHEAETYEEFFTHQIPIVITAIVFAVVYFFLTTEINFNEKGPNHADQDAQPESKCNMVIMKEFVTACVSLLNMGTMRVFVITHFSVHSLLALLCFITRIVVLIYLPRS